MVLPAAGMALAAMMDSSNMYKESSASYRNDSVIYRDSSAS